MATDAMPQCCACVAGHLAAGTIGLTHVDIEWTDAGALMMLDVWGENGGTAAVRSAIAHVRARLASLDVAREYRDAQRAYHAATKRVLSGPASEDTYAAYAAAVERVNAADDALDAALAR